MAMINKRLINLVPSSKKFVFWTVLFKWLALISNALMIFSIAEIYRRIKTPDGKSVLMPVILIVISVIITFLTTIFSSLTSFKTSSQVKKTMRSLIYEKLLKLGPEYQEKTETGKLVQLASEGVEQIEIWFGQYLPQFFYSMIAAITTFAILATQNLKMALILLVCVPLIPLSIVAVQKIAKKILRKYLDQYATLADNYLENLQGLTTLEIYQADEFKQQQIGVEAENFRKITMKVLSFQLNSTIIMDIVAYAGAALGIMAALSAYFTGAIQIEQTFVCIMLSADFFIPLRRLGSYFHTAMNGATASDNIFALLDTPEKQYGKTKIDDFSATNSGTLFEISSLNYYFGCRQILKNVNLSIKNGSFTAFVGKSGSGKSTTAKILAGINLEYQGSVKVGLSELKDIALDSIYKNISYISHKDWIFKGTIKDCLLEGNPNACENQLFDALRQVQLEDFVKENGGLDFEIKENASNLSGGQKQRLSIARALLHNSQIYIFDEATSNIDVESEKAVLDLLHSLKGKKTIIMISHRKENCDGADQIYFFENGNVSEVQ